MLKCLIVTAVYMLIFCCPIVANIQQQFGPSPQHHFSNEQRQRIASINATYKAKFIQLKQSSKHKQAIVKEIKILREAHTQALIKCLNPAQKDWLNTCAYNK
eukprot:COSAG01_NODE_10266_length_2205_cov_28.589844_3_plen_102_part_00